MNTVAKTATGLLSALSPANEAPNTTPMASVVQAKMGYMPVAIICCTHLVCNTVRPARTEILEYPG